jgi:hypothetical protein
MNTKVLVIFALAIATVNGVSITYNPASFCERYATALFGSATATTEANLITAVLDRALSGNFTGITGILNIPVQKQYFNGSYTTPAATNYYTNTAARGQLVAALLNFFEYAMFCRATNPSTPANMGTIHAPMKINKEVWDSFVNEVVNTLLSFGVSAAVDGPYAGALFGQFLMGAPQAICTASDCAAYTAFGEFTSGTVDGSLAWISSTDQTQTLSIATNGWVHWNIGITHNVAQSDGSWNAITGGWTSGAIGAVGGYSRQFTTAGTYYFICQAHPTLMRGTIIVGGSSGGSGAASVSASAFAVLASMAVALSALHF